MAVLYVASSKTLSNWGASVGISKSLYKIGFVEDGDAAGVAKAVEALNVAGIAGATDWKLVKSDEAGALTADELASRLDAAGIVVDPKYYPKLRREPGIVRVRPETVENSILVERAMANEASLDIKIKPADIADWLIRLALGGEPATDA
jgi:hypothetical protein